MPHLPCTDIARIFYLNAGVGREKFDVLERNSKSFSEPHDTDVLVW